MRFMMMVRANKNTEAGVMPDQRLIAAMGKYNEEMAKAGVLLDLAGLQPSKKGARIRFSGGKPTVIDGPFAETKELIAGYWLIQVKSKEEAIEWAKRCPVLMAKQPKARSSSASFSNLTTSLPVKRSKMRASWSRSSRRKSNPRTSLTI